MAEIIQGLGEGGVVADIPAVIAPINTFSDSLNMRFIDQAIETFTGEELYATVAIAPSFGIQWRRPDQTYNVFGKNGDFVRVDAAGSVASIFSSVDAKYSNSKWQSTYFNGGYAIVVNNGKSTPLYSLFGSLVTNLQELPGWNWQPDVTISAKVIKSFGYSLVAANLTLDDGSTITYAPSTIRISVQAATGAIPDIWQPGLTTDTADEFEINSTSPILDMAELRGSLFVYTATEIHVIKIGQQTTRQSYSTSRGILNTNCVVEADNFHYVVDKNDIYRHSGGGGFEPVCEKRTRRKFFKELNDAHSDKVFVLHESEFKEIWICYPSGVATTCNKAMVINYRSGATYFRSIPNATDYFRGGKTNGTTFSNVADSTYFVNGSTQVLVTYDGFDMWDGTAFTPVQSYLERKKMSSGDVSGTTLISSLYPLVDAATNSVSIRMVGQNSYTRDVNLSLNDPESSDLFVLDTTSDTSQNNKVDPRSNGRLINYRMFSSGYWRLAAMSFDAKPASRR